jgi:hypothetical protein
MIFAAPAGVEPGVLVRGEKPDWVLSCTPELSTRPFCTFPRELSSLRRPSHIGGPPAMIADDHPP